MPLDRAGLCRLVEHSATLAERLAAAPDSSAAAPASPEAHERLARWSVLTARGDPDRFARRLRFDGVSHATALAALDDACLAGWRKATPLPAWALLLGRVMSIVEPSERVDVSGSAQASGFEPVLRLFLRVGRAEIAARAGEAADQMEARAHDRLDCALLRRLSWLATPTLSGACDAWNERSHAPGEEFVPHLMAGGIVSLFSEYASLARLMATCTLHWAESTAELLCRLSDDAELLALEFNDAQPLGSVVDVQPGLSDSHRRGRTVCVLHFACGTALVYKPRALAMERGFSRIVDWLSERTDEPRLAALHVLDRDTYGWMEFAIPAECADDEQVTRYFDRGGMLLCLMHTLGGSDMHRDNVLARGEHPLAIDLEALAGPAVAAQGINDDDSATPWSHVLASALSTGMVPLLRPRYDGTAESSGGLTASGGTASRQTNVPVLRGARVQDEHADAVLAGYRRMYSALCTHRDELLAPEGPLWSIHSARSRVVFRPTQVYLAALERATAPRMMRAGVDRSIEMEVLRQPFTRYPERHRLWPALSAELDAMELLDVPMFDSPASSSVLSTTRGDIAGYVTTPGFDRIVARVHAMGPTDLERQLQYIRLAYTGHRQRRDARSRAAGVGDLGSPSCASLGDAALDALDVLARAAVPASDGGVTWHALGGEATVGDLHEVDLSLGSGRVGIAMFLAAAARACAGDRARQIALAALSPLIAPSAGPARCCDSGSASSLSASRGDGGVAYGLVKIGQLLNEPELLHVAQRVAARITRARIAAANDFTVWNGVSGALLGLLAVHDATGSADALDHAVMCGRRLLSARVVDVPTRLRAWPARDGDFASGFALGAAGIAHALLSLYRRTGSCGLREAAEESAEFEATMFVASNNDWLDRASWRGGVQPPVARFDGWCHGATGIGLARVANLGVSDTPRARADVAAALAAIDVGAPGQPPRLSKPDHLWCGNLGRAELLMTAGDRLRRPDLVDRAQALARGVAALGRKRGTYGGGMMDAVFTPGLFDGLAGIGYELLRVHDPLGIPSVLLFE